MKVTLGKQYRDSISGYEGVAIGRTTYLYGCVRVCLSPMKLKDDGDLLPDFWFDEEQLVAMRAGKIIKKEKSKPPSGDSSRSISPNRDPV